MLSWISLHLPAHHPLMHPDLLRLQNRQAPCSQFYVSEVLFFLVHRQQLIHRSIVHHRACFLPFLARDHLPCTAKPILPSFSIALRSSYCLRKPLFLSRFAKVGEFRVPLFVLVERSNFNLTKVLLIRKWDRYHPNLPSLRPASQSAILSLILSYR